MNKLTDTPSRTVRFPWPLLLHPWFICCVSTLIMETTSVISVVEMLTLNWWIFQRVVLTDTFSDFVRCDSKWCRLLSWECELNVTGSHMLTLVYRTALMSPTHVCVNTRTLSQDIQKLHVYSRRIWQKVKCVSTPNREPKWTPLDHCTETALCGIPTLISKPIPVSVCVCVCYHHGVEKPVLLSSEWQSSEACGEKKRHSCH